MAISPNALQNFLLFTNHRQTGCMEKKITFGFLNSEKTLVILARWKKWEGGYFE